MINFTSRLHSYPQQSHLGGGAPNVFTLCPSEWNPDLTAVHPANYPEGVPPLYTVKISLWGDKIVLYHGSLDSGVSIANAHLHTFSSTVDLSLRGEPVSMKSQMSGSFTVTSSHKGQFKWKVNPLTGTCTLQDHVGVKIAQLRSSGFPDSGKKKLNLLVPCNGFFLELILLSAMVVKVENNTISDALEEAGDAVFGS